MADGLLESRPGFDLSVERDAPERRRARRRLRLGAIGLAVVAGMAAQGCAAPTRLGPQPAELTTKAVVVGTPNARFFPDTDPDSMFAEGLLAFQREMLHLGVDDPNTLPTANYLAVSGGGDDGAFGAGLLVGWTETGTRPEFKIVTGVSTGSLIAPFAFLGPAYDQKLASVYTNISANDIFVERGLTAAIFDDALSDTAPLFGLISKMLDEGMLADIAREYEKGRLLLIGTTYLDARRPVVWNIGAIAASGHPEAPDLIRKILLASAAVPAVFPPVLIDVEIDGTAYQELHVDGGAIAQLFLYPPEVGRRMTETHIKRERRAYIIRNGRVGAEWSEVERTTMNIAGKAISTMIHTSGLNDLFRLYMITQRDGVDYNLAYIDDDFVAPPKDGDFDPKYMKPLFEYGRAQGRAGYPWHKAPPFAQQRPVGS